MPKTFEQCKKIREEMRAKILKESALYFARYGFADTKISDLAKHIGIGQGTIYLYFKSKEELFDEIVKTADNHEEQAGMHMLTVMPIPAKKKIEMMSEEIAKRVNERDEYIVKITLHTQMTLEKNDSFYELGFYKDLAKIIEQGQKEGSVTKEDPLYLADLYWGTVYFYAVRRLFVPDCMNLKKETLIRLLEA